MHKKIDFERVDTKVLIKTTAYTMDIKDPISLGSAPSKIT